MSFACPSRMALYSMYRLILVAHTISGILFMEEWEEKEHLLKLYFIFTSILRGRNYPVPLHQ